MKDKQQRFDEEFLKVLNRIRKKRELLEDREKISWKEFSKIIVKTPGAMEDLERKVLEIDKAISKKIGIKFDGGLR